MVLAGQVTLGKKVVNVASVPQRSPFRYPGGKTWLIPHVRAWLRSMAERPQELIEPFAGGAIVGLTAASERLAKKVRLVEKDPHVAAVWETILKGDVESLIADIMDFKVTAASVRAVLNHPPQTTEERAFATIVRNRVQRGGILAPGAGLIKEGENGKGLTSRWYPQTLKKRIEHLSRIKSRLRFHCGDGISYIEENRDRRDVVFFIDPPYTVAGRRLYTYNEIDHPALFRLVSTVAGDFLMTYDNTSEIRRLADRHSFDTQPVPMKNTHHAKLTELLIGKDLGWARRKGTA